MAPPTDGRPRACPGHARVFAALALAVGLLALQPAQAETVRIAVGEWKPFISKELPNYGSHTEIVTRVFESAGFEVDYQFMPWNRAYEQTRLGDYAATFSWFKTEKRAKEVLYPETPIDVREHAVYYNKKRFPEGVEVTSLKDIVEQDLKIVGAIGYWYIKPLKSLGAQLHSVPNAKLSWRMLALGRADVYIEDIAVAQREIPEVLDAEAARDIAQGKVLRRAPMYLLFTKNAEIGRRLLKAWEAHAPKGISCDDPCRLPGAGEEGAALAPGPYASAAFSARTLPAR